MQARTLKPEDLRVETFATEAAASAACRADFFHTRTQAPKDCPETLPQFC